MENTDSEHINHESPENLDSADSHNQAPPTTSDESTTVQPQQPLVPRRSGRIRSQVLEWWKAMFAVGLTSHAQVTTDTPNSDKQATNVPKIGFWQKGIDRELASHHKNRTWKLVTRSEANNVLTSRWVFNVKQLPDENGNLAETANLAVSARFPWL